MSTFIVSPSATEDYRGMQKAPPFVVSTKERSLAASYDEIIRPKNCAFCHEPRHYNLNVLGYDHFICYFYSDQICKKLAQRDE